MVFVTVQHIGCLFQSLKLQNVQMKARLPLAVSRAVRGDFHQLRDIRH